MLHTSDSWPGYPAYLLRQANARAAPDRSIWPGYASRTVPIYGENHRNNQHETEESTLQPLEKLLLEWFVALDIGKFMFLLMKVGPGLPLFDHIKWALPQFK
jgi:hypothetical protein